MTIEQKLIFDEKFQLGIFELMLMDQDFSSKCILYLQPNYFQNEHLASLFLVFKKLQEKYGTFPTKTMVSNEIAQISDPKRMLVLNAVFKEIIKGGSGKDYVYIKSNLEKFCKKALAFQIHGKIQQQQNSDPDTIFENIEKMVEGYQAISFSKVKTESLTNIEYILERSQEDTGKLVPTFMPTIDLELGGGVPRGTLTVGLSGTNVGKSIWLINWAYHLCRNGYKVFYVNLEGYERQPMVRLISRALQAPYSMVRYNKLTDYQREDVKKIQDGWGKNFQFFHNSTFGFTIEDLVPILRAKKTEFNFDVVMVDYGQILTSKRKFENLRSEQAYIHRGLATVAGEVDCAMVTVAQGNRDAQSKNSSSAALLRMTDVSECFEINRAAATVFTLNRSDKDQQGEFVRVLMDKQRDGKTNVVEICKTSFPRMSFYGGIEEGLGFLTPQQYIQATNPSDK